MSWCDWLKGWVLSFLFAIFSQFVLNIGFSVLFLFPFPFFHLIVIFHWLCKHQLFSHFFLSEFILQQLLFYITWYYCYIIFLSYGGWSLWWVKKMCYFLFMIAKNRLQLHLCKIVQKQGEEEKIKRKERTLVVFFIFGSGRSIYMRMMWEFLKTL